jgi:hypothetical protein
LQFLQKASLLRLCNRAANPTVLPNAWEIPGKEEFMGENAGVLVPIFGILVPIVSVVAVFTFLSISVWLGHRKQEREAFYKAETLRRITEASGEGAKAAIDLMREDERLKRIKTREGLKIGGLVNVAVGVALLIFLRVLLGNNGVYLCGLIPGLIGVALLGYVRFMAAPVE